MKFAQPLWLLAGLIACAALVWRYRRLNARQRTELAKFASANLIAQLTASVSPARRQFKRGLVIAGVACVAIALARPLVGFRWEEAKRKGLDVMFAVDTSKSMLAQDVKPDRLTRAKMAVEDLLGKMAGDRVGLVAFAGNSFLQCPLTLDYDAFRQSLDALDTKIIPRGGTDLAAAIHETEAALEGNGNNERILVLLTDGEDLEGNALDAARAAAKNGLKIFTVGVGSASGELIPALDEAGGTQFTKDASGQFVKSRLDETMLKQIAEATGAMYQPLGQQAQGLETIYSQCLAKFTRRELASRMQKVGIERFQWPLALGLFFLVLEPLVGIRRNQRVTKPAIAPRPALAASWNRMARPATAAAAVAMLVAAGSAQASVGSAEKAFQNGDYSKAEQEYRQAAAKHPDKPVLAYNHGAAAYKSGGFDQAAESFAKAMKTDDLTLQQDNYYNLGNTQYRLGQKTEKANAQETIKSWEQSVQSYEAALQLKADDADAKFNRDLVKRKLEELKKQEQQKQDQQKQQQNQDQKNQDQKDQDQKDDQQAKSGQDKDQNKPDEKNDSQNKEQNSPGQQARQDPKQPKDQQQKSGADQHQKPQDKQEQANQKPEPKNQGAQAGQKPDEKRKAGAPQPRNPQPQENAPEQADARPEPGKMSRDEARQLLDSLKSGDRKMPLSPYARGNESAKNDEPVKDW
ncbi:MAG: VWA domain-containing protein [Verrucomicrobiota bacterium]|nr:VWA domain-containing protein [Verrucomicrobiota bacterium]MCC6821430.1 VWA domain-containing protein [Limisphaerales bacterium]